MNRERTLTREVSATQIPAGVKELLPAGIKVFIHQTLGGSYTVQTDHGLFRIDGADGDAVGEQAADHSVDAATLADGAPDPAAIWDQLKRVYDPEIPVNIVDLGLVYECAVTKNDDATRTVDIKMTLTAPGCGMGEILVQDAGTHAVKVAMTLTAPGCGMGPAIAEDAKTKILLVPGVAAADVRITWDPPWNQSMISEEGKMKLGLV
jgi:probable FeS assembly SUF system protein SufT